MAALRYLGIFLVWNLGAGAALLFLPAPGGLVLALLLSAWLLWGYMLRPREGREARRWAALRLRPLAGETLRWTLIAVPVLLVLTWALGEVYVRLVPVPPESLNPFESLTASAWGRLSVAIFAIAVAPILEEFFFRGLIQRSLETRWGTAWGVAGAAGLFAFVHLLPWLLPLHFFLGAAFGFAVVATRSIWTGVALHAANNAVAMLGLPTGGDTPEPTATVWETGLTLDWWTSLAALALALALGAWVARGLWAAGRNRNLV